MSDPVRPLGGVSYDGYVRIEEAAPQGMIQIRGEQALLDVKNAATGVAGVDMPEPRGANCVGARGILWMAPDELLVLVPLAEREAALSTITASLAGQHALVADVSDMRAMFHVTGHGVREVLAKLSPADFAPEAFAPGELRRTRFAQAAAGVWLRDAQTAQLFCFRSVAAYMYGLLTHAADPDAKVGYFAL